MVGRCDSHVQGDRAEDIEEKLDRLLVKAKNSQSELVDEILEPPKPRKTKQAKKGANLEDTDTGTGKELKAIWKAIDEIKTTIACLVEAKANTTGKKSNHTCKETKIKDTMETSKYAEDKEQQQFEKQLKKTAPNRSPFITGYFTPVEKKRNSKKNSDEYESDELISCKVRISELEIKLRKLDAEKLSLQSQVNKLNKLNNELKQQVSLSNRTSDDKSSKPEEKSSKYGEERKKKPLVIVAGDSLLRDIKGWLMSRSKQVKINSFPGATTSDMFDFLKPLLKKDPDHVILNIGTNDLQDTGLTPRDTVHDIVRLAKYITGQGIKCSISSIIFRDDDLWMKGQAVNKILMESLPESIAFIDNSNIELGHLNRSGLHLNRRGNGAFAYNLINHIKTLDLKRCI